MESPFLLLSVREGREDLAKAEVDMRFLGAKFAFSRPGFLSFKAGKATSTSGGGASWELSDTEGMIFPLRTALFAGKVSQRADGEGKSRGGKSRGEGTSDAGCLSAQVEASFVAMNPPGMEKLPRCVHLHCLDYLEGATRDDTPVRVGSLEAWEREVPGLSAALAPFFARAGNPKRLNEEAATGEGILQIYRVSAREFWVGVSVLRSVEFGLPGGESGVPLPEQAPSRSYLKIEEAIRILERVKGKKIFKPEERAIEIGCAPGGACYSLLQRGLRVLGVDRAEMAPVVGNNPRFSQVVSAVGDWQIPESMTADWLLIDIHAEPGVAVRETRAVMEHFGPGLKGIFFTLKLNREQYAISAERLSKTLARELGLRTWFIKHLPSHHQEFLFFGVK